MGVILRTFRHNVWFNFDVAAIENYCMVYGLNSELLIDNLSTMSLRDLKILQESLRNFERKEITIPSVGYAICPKCFTEQQDDIDAKSALASNSYGKIPEEEYYKLLKASQEVVAVNATLQEEYDIGVSAQGDFGVTYKCSCKTCGFTFTFENYIRSGEVLDR